MSNLLYLRNIGRYLGRALILLSHPVLYRTEMPTEHSVVNVGRLQPATQQYTVVFLEHTRIRNTHRNFSTDKTHATEKQ